MFCWPSYTFVCKVLFWRTKWTHQCSSRQMTSFAASDSLNIEILFTYIKNQRSIEPNNSKSASLCMCTEQLWNCGKIKGPFLFTSFSHSTYSSSSLFPVKELWGTCPYIVTTIPSRGKLRKNENQAKMKAIPNSVRLVTSLLFEDPFVLV